MRLTHLYIPLLPQRALEDAARRTAPAVTLFIDHEEEESGGGGGFAPVADGHVEVYFLLTLNNNSKSSSSGAVGWSEDDTLCLVCSPSSSALSNANANNTARSGGDNVVLPSCNDATMYLATEQQYETFEYTDAPAAPTAATLATLSPSCREFLRTQGVNIDEDNSDVVHQQQEQQRYQVCKVRIKLPSVGGRFHVSYVRTITVPPVTASGATTKSTSRSSRSGNRPTQCRVKLAQSETFTVRVPVHAAHPDGVRRGGGGEGSGRDALGNSPIPTALKRRGAAPLINSAAIGGGGGRDSGQCQSSSLPPPPPPPHRPLCIWAEDLSQLSTLIVVVSLPSRSYLAVSKPVPTSNITRAMVWATTASSVLTFYVEVDVVVQGASAASTSAASASAVTTHYAVLEIHDDELQLLQQQHQQQHVTFDFSAAYGQFDTEGRFVCKLPYQRHLQQQRQQSSSKMNKPLYEFEQLQQQLVVKENSNSKNIDITCKFCSNSLLRPSSITEMKPLPSGLLDTVRAIPIMLSCLFRFME